MKYNLLLVFLLLGVIILYSLPKREYFSTRCGYIANNTSPTCKHYYIECSRNCYSKCKNKRQNCCNACLKATRLGICEAHPGFYTPNEGDYSVN